MEQRKIFSKIGLAYFVLAALTIGLQLLIGTIFAASNNQDQELLITVLCMAAMYLVAMPVCVKMMGRLPKKKLYENTMKAGKWFFYLCIGVFVMYAGNLVGNAVNAILSQVTGLDLMSQMQDMMLNEPIWFILLFTVILAPILEELVFRKVLVDRAIVFGDKTAILLSGFLFGLFHGNFSQLFYAFGLGCLLAYIYIRTGKIKYTISLHMAINFLGGFLPSIFLKKMNMDMLLGSTDIFSGESMAYLFGNIGIILLYVLYIVCMVAVAITGLILFILNIKKAKLLPGEYSLPRKQMARAMFGNVGIILFCVISVVLFGLNMVP